MFLLPKKPLSPLSMAFFFLFVHCSVFTLIQQRLVGFFGGGENNHPRLGSRRWQHYPPTACLPHLGGGWQTVGSGSSVLEQGRPHIGGSLFSFLLFLVSSVLLDSYLEFSQGCMRFFFSAKSASSPDCFYGSQGTLYVNFTTHATLRQAANIRMDAVTPPPRTFGRNIRLASYSVQCRCSAPGNLRCTSGTPSSPPAIRH